MSARNASEPSSSGLPTLDPAYYDKKIVDLSDDELIALGFLGENVIRGVTDIVERAKAHPDLLGSVTCFMVDRIRNKYTFWAPPPGAAEPHASPTSPISSTSHPNRSAETRHSQPSDGSDVYSVVAPDLISKYERKSWYHGISTNPPELMWRSDLETNPFPIPPPGARFFSIPIKTAHGVFNTLLNDVWDDVAPRILVSMKARGLKYSALKTARFSTAQPGGQGETLGPVVIWIAVCPNTTNAEAVRDATPDILHILADFQITDVVVEWYEGSVARLVGPPLMSVEKHIDPRFGFNHPFNSGLGIPIARQSDDAQGTLALLFKEVKTSSGDVSERILGLITKHVASDDIATDYEFNGMDPQYILVCGDRRLARALQEMDVSIIDGLDEAKTLAQFVEREKSMLNTPKEDRMALDDFTNKLIEQNRRNATLQALYKQIKEDWKDADNRRFGVVDWAPKISVGIDDRCYTRDIATFAVNKEKLENFERNIVDLGNQYDANKLANLFWPVAAGRDCRTIPFGLQLPIRRALPRRFLVTPDTDDWSGNILYIVGKYGNTTKLTLGRSSGMEAYICTDLGYESKEMVFYNYGKNTGNFSDYGDSGSLIFSGDGDAVAILHSGIPRGTDSDNHVTFGTPIWWVIKQILVKYPSAEFCGMTYDLD